MCRRRRRWSVSTPVVLDRYLPLAEVTNRQMAPLFVVSGNGEHEPVARSGDKFLEWNGISTPASRGTITFTFHLRNADRVEHA